MKRLKEYRGGALLYSITMMLLLSIIGTAVLSNGFHAHVIGLHASLEHDLYRNALSGMAISKDVDINELTIDLYGEGGDSVRIERRCWGLFAFVSSIAFRRGDSCSLLGLVGLVPDKKKALSIYGSERPLSLCGNTVLKGDCYLTSKSIKRAYIEGQSFEGKRFVNGNVYRLNNRTSFPKIITTKEVEFFLENIMEGSEYFDASLLEDQDSLSNSFKNKATHISSSGHLKLADVDVSGRIIITARDSITIKSTAKLQDVILYAPTIVFEEGFSGSVQAFGKNKLKVGQQCSFVYPSMFCLLDPINQENAGMVLLGKEVSFEGDIISVSTVDKKAQPKIEIVKGVNVTGSIISPGIVDVKGNIHGSVYCSSIGLKTASSYYENHLLDAEIDVTKRPERFVGSLYSNVGNNVREEKLVKWLY